MAESRQNGDILETNQIQLSPVAMRVEMALRGWTQTDLAEKAGLSRETVHTAVSGQRIHISTARKIAAALEAHPPLEALASIVKHSGERSE